MSSTDVIRLDFLEKIKADALQAQFDGNLRQLTPKEVERYGTLHPDLQLLFDETRKELLLEQSPLKNPMDIYLVEGHRGKERQTQAYAGGFSKVFFPNSTHNTLPSNGMDTAPFPIDWQDLKRFRYMNSVMMNVAARLEAQGKISKIRFGADFNMDGNLTNDKFVDLPHCERRPQTTDT